MKKPPQRPNYWTEFSHLLPRGWTRIGHPIPVPGGFVFVVAVALRGRLIYPINRYRANAADTAVFTPVIDPSGLAMIYANSREARTALSEAAHHIESTED